MDQRSQYADVVKDVLAKSMDGGLLVMVCFSDIDRIHISEPSLQSASQHQATSHHMRDLAKDFILTIPVCPVWSSSNTLPCSLLGTITLIPHIEQPNSIVISNLRLKNGRSCVSTSSGHPSLVYSKTLDRIGSLRSLNITASDLQEGCQSAGY